MEEPREGRDRKNYPNAGKEHACSSHQERALSVLGYRLTLLAPNVPRCIGNVAAEKDEADPENQAHRREQNGCPLALSHGPIMPRVMDDGS